MFFHTITDVLLKGFTVNRLFKMTIGKKLNLMILLLLLGTVVSVTKLSGKLFTEDSTAMIQHMNSENASHLASEVRTQFEILSERIRSASIFLSQNPILLPKELVRVIDTTKRDTYLKEFFNREKDILGFYILSYSPEFEYSVVDSAAGKAISDLGVGSQERLFDTISELDELDIDKVANGEVQLVEVKLEDDSTAFAYAIPFLKEMDKTLLSLAVIRPERLTQIFSNTTLVTSYLVDASGRVLAHPDSSLSKNRVDLSSTGVVKQLLESKLPNGQSRYVDAKSGEAKLAAFDLVGVAKLGVIAEVPEAKAYEAPLRAQYRSYLTGLVVLSIALFIGYVFSKSLTWPIRLLVGASEKVSQGDFSTRLTPKGQDEVAQLSTSFNKMSEGLEERDRVKDIFNKFHNKEIADEILSGKVALGGENKEAIVFFSDIRNFTAWSEGMKPEEVVEMLNVYMTKMVRVIRFHGGVVDKYVGDAIMALWGVPHYKGNEAVAAVKACITMRSELAQLNEERISAGKPAIKIGMGLNLGQVVAGNIGSEEKMEYTVIGDTVNTASRIESMTKEFGTDLLIAKSVVDKLDNTFILEKCEDILVKGKAEALTLYKVKGFINSSGVEEIVETPWSNYEKSKSDKSAA